MARRISSTIISTTWPSSGGHPIDHKTYVLRHLRTVLFFNVPVDRILSEDGSLATYRIERADLEGVESRIQPGWSEVLNSRSTFESWEDVETGTGSRKGQLVVNDDLRGGGGHRQPPAGRDAAR